MSDTDTETARIVTTSEVLHGQPRIDGTRIGVFMLGEMIRNGDWTAREVAGEYPSLSRADVDAALAYYDNHPDEMDQARKEQEAAIAGLRERSRVPNDDDGDADTEA